jgi:hypothetical protein
MNFRSQLTGIMSILNDPVTRFATWTCLALSFFNSMTGIQILAVQKGAHDETTLCSKNLGLP